MRNILGVLGILVRFALLFGCRCQPQHRLYRAHGEGLSQALRSNRSSRSIDDKRCSIYCARLHSGARGGCSGVQRKSGEREEEEKSEKNDEEEQVGGGRGEGVEEGREEAVALRRVATSCTKGSDRTSYLTRACCASSVPTHPLSGSSFLISLSLRSPSPFLSFRVRRASALFFPPPGRS